MTLYLVMGPNENRQMWRYMVCIVWRFSIMICLNEWNHFFLLDARFFCHKIIILQLSSHVVEYSCAVTPQIRQAGNRLSGLAGTAYASLLA